MKIDPKAKSEYDRASYAFWKARNLCVRCHKQDAFTLAGRVRCAECTEKNRAEKARYRAKHRDTVIATNTDWRARMKESGRCEKCARELEDDKHTLCAVCRAKQRAADAEHRRAAGRLPKSVAMDCGLCGVCNKRPAMEGRKTCPDCYAQNMRNLKKANEAKNTRNHPWHRMTRAEVERRRAAG